MGLACASQGRTTGWSQIPITASSFDFGGSRGGVLPIGSRTQKMQTNHGDQHQHQNIQNWSLSMAKYKYKQILIPIKHKTLFWIWDKISKNAILLLFYNRMLLEYWNMNRYSPIKAVLRTEHILNFSSFHVLWWEKFVHNKRTYKEESNIYVTGTANSETSTESLLQIKSVTKFGNRLLTKLLVFIHCRGKYTVGKTREILNCITTNS